MYHFDSVCYLQNLMLTGILWKSSCEYEKPEENINERYLTSLWTAFYGLVIIWYCKIQCIIIFHVIFSTSLIDYLVTYTHILCTVHIDHLGAGSIATRNGLNLLMPRGNRKTTYLNKPAAESCRFIKYVWPFCYHQALKGKSKKVNTLQLVLLQKKCLWLIKCIRAL